MRSLDARGGRGNKDADRASEGGGGEGKELRDDGRKGKG